MKKSRIKFIAGVSMLFFVSSRGIVNAAGMGDLAGRLNQAVFPGKGTNASGRQAIKEALAEILATPFGRTLARQFLDQHFKIEIAFEPIRESTWAVVDGQKVLLGSPAHLSGTFGHPRVILTDLYLQENPRSLGHEISHLLVHEIFGHALEEAKAKKAGVAKAFNNYEDNEINAELVEWIFMTQCRHCDKSYNYKRNLYLSNPQKYYWTLYAEEPWYAKAALKLDDFKNMPLILEGRLAYLRRLDSEDKRKLKKFRFWEGFIHHLLLKHNGQALAGVRVDRVGFKDLESRITYNFQYWNRSLWRIHWIEKSLKNRIAYFQSSPGRVFLANMSSSINTPAGKKFFIDFKKTLNEHRLLLKKAFPSPPVNPRRPIFFHHGQITWKQLISMWREDVSKNRDEALEEYLGIKKSWEPSITSLDQSLPPPAQSY